MNTTKPDESAAVLAAPSFEAGIHSKDALVRFELAPVPRKALNVNEACAALGVSWDVWHEHIEPDVRLIRIGRRKLVAVAELDRWLADRAEALLERR
jgi:hypothetical protein